MRLLAGQMGEQIGRFKTVQPVQMIDMEVEAGKGLTHSIPEGMDTCIIYVYEGSGSIAGGSEIGAKTVALLDATSPAKRSFELVADSRGPLEAMLFAGKKLKEPIAWRGPIVMNTQVQTRSRANETIVVNTQAQARSLARIMDLSNEQQGPIIMNGSQAPQRKPGGVRLMNEMYLSIGRQTCRHSHLRGRVGAYTPCLHM